MDFCTPDERKRHFHCESSSEGTSDKDSVEECKSDGDVFPGEITHQGSEACDVRNVNGDPESFQWRMVEATLRVPNWGAN